MIPRATLRLQFHKGFTFADAEALVPYFARLGVSHLYASPIAVARPGSLHGYDVIDPTQVNPELGGEAALRSLAARLAAAGLGLIVDIVPNHMAADTANAWWADVLRHGRASRYARFFDIDWTAGDKVLLPILGKPLEETLAAGEIEVGQETLRYFSHRLPLAPGSAGSLRDVLERQHYRLAWWRSAGDCINWRRFFDINELVCLRMEEPEVFEAVHALPLRLHAEGLIDGLRIDHVDGLTDPAGYCRTLRRRLGEGAWLVVEKILLRGETLPRDWACDGTTGYDFMNEVSALQHDASGEAPLATAWAALSGRPADFAPEEQAARREIVARSFSAQLEACAAAFAAGRDRPADLAARAHRAAGAFPGLSHLRRRRRPLAGRPHGAAAGSRRRAQDLPRHRPLGCRRGPAPVRLSRRHAGHGALSAIERARRRQGRRGHGLLSLRPAALAQRCRLRRGNLFPRRRCLPCPRAGARRRPSARDAGDGHA